MEFLSNDLIRFSLLYKYVMIKTKKKKKKNVMIKTFLQGNSLVNVKVCLGKTKSST